MLDSFADYSTLNGMFHVFGFDRALSLLLLSSVCLSVPFMFSFICERKFHHRLTPITVCQNTRKAKSFSIQTYPSSPILMPEARCVSTDPDVPSVSTSLVFYSHHLKFEPLRISEINAEICKFVWRWEN